TPTGGTCTPQQVFDFLSFDPETVETYEVGYKASYGRRLTIALSGFYSDYTDVQVPGSIGTTVNGQQTFVGITTNAGKARIQGIEFEGNLLVAKDIGAPGSRLNLNWAGGYIDAKYKQFIDSRGIDVANRRAFQNTPKWTASGTLAYSIPAFGGDISTSTTVSYRSKSQQFELRTPGLDQAGYALWDASIVWTSEGGRYSLGVHGRNLTDKQYIVSGNNFLSQNPDTGNFNRNAAGALIPTLGREGVLTAYYGNPRQVFVSAGVKF
ncbi:MAG: TonB-dependent receptor, partial [Rhizorhabdus sp.]